MAAIAKPAVNMDHAIVGLNMNIFSFFRSIEDLGCLVSSFREYCINSGTFGSTHTIKESESIHINNMLFIVGK